MDLNLIRTFLSIYETGSLTKTAQALFVTQPSVSHALGRLRREFVDELFLRSGRTMAPTPLATDLYPVLKESVSRIDHVVDGARAFEPARSTRRFRLCLSDLGELGFLPQILKRISEEAPFVEVDVVPMDIGRLPEWLARGSVDAAIASWPLPGEYSATVLKREKYVCVMRADFAMAGPTLSLEEFTSAKHAIVDRATGHQLAENVMQDLGIVRRSTVAVHHFAVLPDLITDCNLLAIAPESMAARWLGKWPLKLADLPFDVPCIEVKLYRRANVLGSEALSWFHSAVISAVEY